METTKDAPIAEPILMGIMARKAKLQSMFSDFWYFLNAPVTTPTSDIRFSASTFRGGKPKASIAGTANTPEPPEMEVTIPMARPKSEIRKYSTKRISVALKYTT